MLGPPKSRRLDEPVAVSLEDLIPANNFSRHLETKPEPEALPVCERVGTASCPLWEPPGPFRGARAALSRLWVMTDPSGNRSTDKLGLESPVMATSATEGFFQRAGALTEHVNPTQRKDNEETEAVSDLYRQLLAAWNARDAAAYAAPFAEDGYVVGFDGSQMNGRAEIERVIAHIFADHLTASYVGKIRDVLFLTPEIAMLRAVAGLVPRGQTDLNPDANAIQTLVARKDGDRWRIALYQNTPAQFHGRPDLAAQLTAELRALI